MASTLMPCVDSIKRQSYADIEIVIVNDGSKDNTVSICDDIVKKYSDVIVIHQENKGQATARKIGFEHSHGQWIAFVDADDTLPEDALSTLLKATENKENISVDVVFGGGESIDREGLVDIADFRHLAVRSEGAIGMVWGCLFRRSILKPYLFQLPEGIVNGEDYIFWLRLVFSTDKPIMVIKENIYNKGRATISNSFIWTADYCYRLNKLREESIPAEVRQEYMSDMISDRKANLFAVAMHSDRKEWKNSDYYKDLVTDMAANNLSFTNKESFYLSLPSRRLRRFYSFLSEKLQEYRQR